MEFSHPYLTEQIIAYIGNKRKLLPLIYSALKETGLDLNSHVKFLDLFSGSGVVSRFAKYLGFEVYSNDWEYYANVINRGFLDVNFSELKTIAKDGRAFSEILEEFNNLPECKSGDEFISKYYGPKSFETEKADGKTERLFYTRENALEIDKIRNHIEEVYGAEKGKIYYLLLAVLIYEAATHTNTSGVFKAFHKEFGGHGKDALKRITTKISLHSPALIDGKYPVHIFQKNANELVKELKNLDVVYMDPPYNQHQYGSNYHMLNTIARWDKIPAPLELNEKGELKEKAAIRHDWVNTKSDYCYKNSAEQSFEELIMNTDAKYILISYSTDGIIPFEKMREICTKRGRLSLVTNEYTTYRGGKQSNKRQNSNIEFILCIDTANKSDEESVRAIDFILKKKKFLLLFKQKYSYKKLNENFKLNSEANTFSFESGNKTFEFESDDFFTVQVPQWFDELSAEDLDMIYEKLYAAVCETKEVELEEILLRLNWKNSNTKKLIKKVPGTLNKLANNKNKDAYNFWIKKVIELKKSHAELYSLIEQKILRIEEIAKVRITK